MGSPATVLIDLLHLKYERLPASAVLSLKNAEVLRWMCWIESKIR